MNRVFVTFHKCGGSFSYFIQCFYYISAYFSVFYTLFLLSLQNISTISVPFRYHRKALNFPELIGQPAQFYAFSSFITSRPPDRLSCRRIVIPFTILHLIAAFSSSIHFNTSLSFSVHLIASLSTSLVHVSLNRRTPT